MENIIKLKKKVNLKSKYKTLFLLNINKIKWELWNPDLQGDQRQLLLHFKSKCFPMLLYQGQWLLKYNA